MEEHLQFIGDATESAMFSSFRYGIVLQEGGADRPLKGVLIGELLFDFRDALQAFVKAFGQVVGVERATNRCGKVVERKQVRLSFEKSGDPRIAGLPGFAESFQPCLSLWGTFCFIDTLGGLGNLSLILRPDMSQHMALQVGPARLVQGMRDRHP